MSYLIVALLLAWAWVHFRYRPQDHSKWDVPALNLQVAPEAISVNHEDVLARLALFRRNQPTNAADARRHMDEFFGQAVDARIEPGVADGVPGEWVLAEGADPNQRLLYLHGGAFRVGSPASHRYIAAELSRRAGVSVFSLDYRMQPEYKIINAHEDARTGYRWLLENGPLGPASATRVFVAGDSEGGCLTLALIAHARDHRLRAADGAVAFAPLTDSTFSSPSWRRNKRTDPFLGPSVGRIIGLPATLLALASHRATGRLPADPEVSPLLGHLDNLPPTLIQVSNAEMLFDDSNRYTHKARAAGSDVRLQVWPTLVHVFQGFGPALPEAQDALELAAGFVREHCEDHTAP